MAIINSDWQVTDIDKKVHLIHFPGRDDESSPIVFDPAVRNDIAMAMDKLSRIQTLTAVNKGHVAFWFGYFYCAYSHFN